MGLAQGAEVGLWVWHFPTFDAAYGARQAFERIGVAFDDLEIKAVDGLSGEDLPGPPLPPLPPL